MHDEKHLEDITLEGKTFLEKDPAHPLWDFVPRAISIFLLHCILLMMLIKSYLCAKVLRAIVFAQIAIKVAIFTHSIHLAKRETVKWGSLRISARTRAESISRKNPAQSLLLSSPSFVRLTIFSWRWKTMHNSAQSPRGREWWWEVSRKGMGSERERTQVNSEMKGFTTCFQNLNLYFMVVGKTTLTVSRFAGWIEWVKIATSIAIYTKTVAPRTLAQW